MNNFIISYYPGSGGNRLLNKLIGKEYKTTNKIYDPTIANSINTSYIYNDSKFDYAQPSPTLTTHCMNVNLIRSVFSNRRIIQINSDYKQSLRRQWVKVTQYAKKTYFENDLDSAFTFIKWHNQYYNQYPKNGTPDEIVHIDNSNDEFAVIMQTELLNTTSFYFDYAYEIFEQYGENAPIIELYRNLIDEQK